MDNSLNKQQPEKFDNYGQYDAGLKSLVKSLQVSFFILVLVIIGMLVYFFTFGGYFTVQPQESIIVLKFGKYLDTFDKDWHWFFPYPVNSFVRIKTNSQLLTVDFRSSQVQLDPMQPPQGDSLEPGRDRYLMTADANIIHASWNFNYRINDPKMYYETFLCPQDPQLNDEYLNAPDGTPMGTRGPQTTLKNMLQSAVIKVTASLPVDNILYTKKNEYRESVEKLFRKMVGDKSGIIIESVTLNNVEAPLKTKAAFEEVTAANQTKSILIDKANEYRVKEENNVVAQQAEIMAAAETYRKQIVSEVKAENIYFEQIYKEYVISPNTVLMALYNYTLSDVLESIDEKFILGSGGEGKTQEIRIKINPEPKRDNKQTPTEGQ